MTPEQIAELQELDGKSSLNSIRQLIEENKNLEVENKKLFNLLKKHAIYSYETIIERDHRDYKATVTRCRICDWRTDNYIGGWLRHGEECCFYDPKQDDN